MTQTLKFTPAKRATTPHLSRVRSLDLSGRPGDLAGSEKTSPVRVSFVIDNLSRAGTESQLLALLRALDRRNVQPSLVLLDGEAESSRVLEPDGVPVLRLGLRKLFSTGAVSAARRLARFWSEHRPDVAQIYFLDSAYFAVPVAKACGVRKVVRVRNNLGYWQTPKHKLLGRLIRPWVDVTLTNSEQGRTALVNGERLPARQVAVIENGVDLAPMGRSTLEENGAERLLSERATHPNRPIRIGTVANLRPVKNIAGLMRCAKQLLAEFPGVRFEVAGGGEQRAELETLHRDLGLGERFALCGSISDVPGFLRTLDVAVLPSLSEGMSNAVLEYMAAGLPVVATAVGANPKLLAGCGVLVPPGDDTALSVALGELLRDPTRAAELGASARRKVEAEYSRDAMRQRFERFYRELAH